MIALQLGSIASIDQKPLEIADLPIPAPDKDELLIRVNVCGICHTDLHIVEGEVAALRLPLIPGHEVIGRVAAMGSNVSGWTVGERAGVPWLHRTCGECEFCVRGEENLCPKAEFTGLDRNGGYAEYIVSPADFAVRIPDAFDDLHAAPLLCAGIIGYRSLRKADLQPGETIGLFGFGASAHLAVQVARSWECRVFVFTRSAAHRKLALHLGAEWAGAVEDAAPLPLDRGVIFAPAGELVPQALRKIRAGGTLAINAIHMTPIPPIAYDLLYGERTVRSVTNATRQDTRDFLDLASRIGIHVETETFPLTDANLALERLKTGKLNGAGVLIVNKR
jgi:propanol-preferring alcohol dehydrogenase